MSEGYLERMDEFVCKSYFDHDMDSRKRGHAVIEANIKSLRTMFSDFRLVCHEAVAQGEWVASACNWPRHSSWRVDEYSSIREDHSAERD